MFMLPIIYLHLCLGVGVHPSPMMIMGLPSWSSLSWRAHHQHHLSSPSSFSPFSHLPLFLLALFPPPSHPSPHPPLSSSSFFVFFRLMLPNSAVLCQALIIFNRAFGFNSVRLVLSPS